MVEKKENPLDIVHREREKRAKKDPDYEAKMALAKAMFDAEEKARSESRGYNGPPAKAQPARKKK